jgi:hypothetical protein
MARSSIGMSARRESAAGELSLTGEEEPFVEQESPWEVELVQSGVINSSSRWRIYRRFAMG